MERSDARKRQAEATPSEAGALTEAEQDRIAGSVTSADWGPSVLFREVARIKAEAVQDERERLAQEIERMIAPLHRAPDGFDRGWAGAVREAARIVRGEGS